MKRLLIIGMSGMGIAILAGFYFRPALMSDANIRASLLEQMPLGSNMGDVRALAEKKDWIEPGAQLTSYMIFRPGTTGMVVTAFGGRWKHDPFPYRAKIGATWEFDESDRLVDIRVHRFNE
jgi:hypothetical protein